MHRLKVKEKYYNLLKSGKKDIELRLYDDKRKLIQIGDMIEFANFSDSRNTFCAEVVALHRAADFATLCQKIDCRRAGMECPEEMIKVLAEFYPAERQKEFGVVGIEVKREE